MSVITFSRDFPKKHPRKDQSTHFVEQILASLDVDHSTLDYFDLLKSLNPTLSATILDDFWGMLSDNCDTEKHHTIRAGKRWKIGDKFSPRVWSDKPYASKQIQFYHPIEIKKLWNFELDFNGVPIINGVYWFDEHTKDVGKYIYADLAKNDGLSEEDFYYWFGMHPKKNKDDKSFDGQILCWNEKVNYI